MKKLFLLSMVCIAAMTLNAQLLFNETFNYTTSKLAGDPNTSATNNTTFVWYNTGKPADTSSGSPSFSFSDPLYYTDYINSGVGKSVVIDYATSGSYLRTDVCRFLPYTSKLVGAGGTGAQNYTGYMYYSFLLNVTDFNAYATSTSQETNDWRDIFLVCEGGSEALGNAIRGRFYIKKDATDPTLMDYSITKNTSFSSTVPPTNTGTFPIGQTCLFVIRQNFAPTTTPFGVIEIILNPALSATEPTTGWLNGSPGDANPYTGTYGIGIRRRNLGSLANMQIGGVRVAQKWSDVIGLSTGFQQVEMNSKNITSIEKSILTNQAGSIKVYNLTGAEILSARTEGKLTTSLSKGLYLVRFVGVDGKVESAKVELK